MVYSCPRCGEKFQSESAGVVRCPSCGGEVQVLETGLRGAPLDMEQKGAWAEAFFATIKDAIADPVIFFQHVSEGDGWLRPWLFSLVISGCVFLVAAAYQTGFNIMASGAGFGGALAHGVGTLSALLMPLSVGTLIAFGVVAVPVGTTMALLIQAGVYHLCLMILGAGRRDFVCTFRVTCYSMAPQVFQIVPFLGGFIAWGWQMALAIIGLKVANQTTYGRSTLAVFLPTILCCGALILVGSAVAGGVFAAIIAASK
ncbi:MAG: YIP1 family protein [bacterium]